MSISKEPLDADNAIESCWAFLRRFESLTISDFHVLKEITSVSLHPKNELIQDIGYTCKTIYFMASGMARIFYFKDDIEVTDSFARENQILVRVESLFTRRPSKKGIRTIENCTVVCIDAPALFKLYDTNQRIERAFRKVFEAAHLETVLRIESLQFHTAEERYELLIQENPDLIQRVPLKYIASYLGITQTSLSRIRSTKN